MTMPRASSKRSSQRTRRRPLATASRPSGPRPGQFRSISWPMGEASMRSCSDSIAQLAAALAKAQIELVNPVKTLTGVIDRWGTGNEGQSYRYAPLSAPDAPEPSCGPSRPNGATHDDLGHGPANENSD